MGGFGLLDLKCFSRGCLIQLELLKLVHVLFTCAYDGETLSQGWSWLMLNGFSSSS